MVATKSAQDAWITRFQSLSYRGSQFFELKGLNMKPLQPKYVNSGTWLRDFGESVSLVARCTHCILNHAPIGEYYQRFNIDGDVPCSCGHVVVQSHFHVLFRCPKHTRTEGSGSLTTIGSLCDFLKRNPTAFAFGTPPREGVG